METFITENSSAIQALASIVSSGMAMVGVIGIWLLWKQLRVLQKQQHLQWEQQQQTKQDRREQFFQSLISTFHTHNWKFVEHFDNPGVRPRMKEALGLEDDAVAFGARVVVLGHVNLLWQVFLHSESLKDSDIHGFMNWTTSWSDHSEDQLKILFERGDLYPLDFVKWLRDKIFGPTKFDSFMGGILKTRMQQFNYL